MFVCKWIGLFHVRYQILEIVVHNTIFYFWLNQSARRSLLFFWYPKYLKNVYLIEKQSLVLLLLPQVITSFLKYGAMRIIIFGIYNHLYLVWNISWPFMKNDILSTVDLLQFRKTQYKWLHLFLMWDIFGRSINFKCNYTYMLNF